MTLRPDWHDDDDDQGALKVVMTGSASDPLDWQPHIRNKPRREALANRFRDPADPFKIVIVRDMWLTGFDAPCLHTMYVDKPMRGHGLMQAIARVNRVFKDKPGGLVVDYLGPRRRAEAGAGDLHGERRHRRDRHRPGRGRRRHAGEVRDLLRHLPRLRLVAVDSRARRRNGCRCCPPRRSTSWRRRTARTALLDAVTELSQAFALAVPHDEALRIRDDVGFFQAVRAVLGQERRRASARPTRSSTHAIRQIVSRAVASDEVVDIFAAAGLKKPDISILSDEFLAEVRGMPQRNLAVELLQKLLNGEIKTRAAKRNVVQARSFAEMLEQAIRKYQNRAIETAQVIEELIELAKEMREATQRGETLGLYRRRGRLLRRPGDQRQRREGARRRHAHDDRPRAGGDRPEERHHRLDRARERPRPAPRHRQAHPAQVRLPARQAGEGDTDGPGAGRGAVRGMGGRHSLRSIVFECRATWDRCPRKLNRPMGACVRNGGRRTMPVRLRDNETGWYGTLWMQHLPAMSRL